MLPKSSWPMAPTSLLTVEVELVTWSPGKRVTQGLTRFHLHICRDIFGVIILASLNPHSSPVEEKVTYQ